MANPPPLNAQMPFYSGAQPGLLDDQNYVFVPYTAWVRIYPELGAGRRLDYVRSMEKMAWRAEDALVGASLKIATPLAATPQFGDNHARLTIVGFNRAARDNAAPTTPLEQFSTGSAQGEKTDLRIVDSGGSLAAGQDTTATVDAEVKALRNAIFAALSPIFPASFTKEDIHAIEYNGVKYGVRKQGGRSFPL